MNAQLPPGVTGTTLLVWIVLIALIVFRASRPQKISVLRMWVSPVLLMALAGFAIYATERLHPTPLWEVAIAVIVGLAAGIPIGALRGRHTEVHATEKHGLMLMGASWATALLYVGAFALRFAIRLVVPLTSPAGTAVGDGLLAFAIAIVAATYFVVYRKYEVLDHTPTSATAASPSSRLD